mmetsp:Transcript_7107/g.13515  ORF Transcript_7107/g.13515 Transcript_7107/m.13515 type:complete len:448 (+) Transcript_7107:523-1866(+)
MPSCGCCHKCDQCLHVCKSAFTQSMHASCLKHQGPAVHGVTQHAPWGCAHPGPAQSWYILLLGRSLIKSLVGNRSVHLTAAGRAVPHTTMHDQQIIADKQIPRLLSQSNGVLPHRLPDMIKDGRGNGGSIAVAAVHGPALRVRLGLVDKQRVVGVEGHVLGMDLVEPRLLSSLGVGLSDGKHLLVREGVVITPFPCVSLICQIMLHKLLVWADVVLPVVVVSLLTAWVADLVIDPQLFKLLRHLRVQISVNCSNVSAWPLAPVGCRLFAPQENLVRESHGVILRMRFNCVLCGVIARSPDHFIDVMGRHGPSEHALESLFVTHGSPIQSSHPFSEVVWSGEWQSSEQNRTVLGKVFIHLHLACIGPVLNREILGAGLWFQHIWKRIARSIQGLGQLRVLTARQESPALNLDGNDGCRWHGTLLQHRRRKLAPACVRRKCSPNRSSHF